MECAIDHSHAHRQYDLTMPANLDSLRYEWRGLALNNGSVVSSQGRFVPFYVDDDACCQYAAGRQFVWGATAGTPTRYILQIDNNTNLGSLTYQVSLNAPTLTHTLPNAQTLTNGLSFWRVQAVDTVNNITIGAARVLTIAAP